MRRKGTKPRDAGKRRADREEKDMSTYSVNDPGELLRGNSYPGRGIIIGLTADGRKAAAAYFIMGRSANSRNRIFIQRDGEITIYPYDESKVEDPSLIIYSPVRRFENRLIVTNGDQTDTVYEGLAAGKSFEESLRSRCFEPDAPNFTPRISGMLTFENGGFGYEMSILKSGDAEGKTCNRFNYRYEPVAGVGHFLHTYRCDGNPIPTFEGEPERVSLPDSADELAKAIWSSLNEDNKISLWVGTTELSTGKTEERVINKYSR